MYQMTIPTRYGHFFLSIQGAAMADMYGALCSNHFKVKDPDAFKKWFDESVRFGDDTQLYIAPELLFDANDVTAEPILGPVCCTLKGHEMYPNAYPGRPQTDDDNDPVCWDLDEFAAIMRTHLLPDETFRLLAVGNEKLRYVQATHLIISHTKVEFNDYFEGD
jgi:hypothetical protein